MPKTVKSTRRVVSALHVRSNLGRMLREIETENSSVIIEKRGAPKAVLLSIRDYVRLAAPEPEVLRQIGEESKRRGLSKLPSKEVDRMIRKVRAKQPRR